MRGDNGADLIAARDVGVRHFADVAVKLGRAACDRVPENSQK